MINYLKNVFNNVLMVTMALALTTYVNNAIKDVINVKIKQIFLARNAEFLLFLVYNIIYSHIRLLVVLHVLKAILKH